MASSLSFVPLAAAGARRKSQNPRKRNHPLPRNSNPNSRRKPKPSLKSLLASEATTYARLPSIDVDDEELSLAAPTIIKLQDCLVPADPIPRKAPALGFDSDEDDDDDELGLDWEGDETTLGLDSDEEDEEAQEMEVFEGEGEMEGGEVKEKGVPAIMRCFDRAKIFVKAGNGGNGVVAFRREKFVPFGGPSGGDGGKGGDVYVEVDETMNSLLPFRKAVHFRGGRGSHGMGSKQVGARGEDVVVKVAPGTVVREANTGVELLELVNPGDRALLLPGGRGGRGNASFKSGMNRVPKIAEKGEEGTEMYDLSLSVPFLFS